MKQEELILELESLAGQLGIAVRYEKGDFEGGYCILRAQKLLLVNRRLAPARKASLLAVALEEIGLENTFVKPALRAFIEDEARKAQRRAS